MSNFVHSWVLRIITYLIMIYLFTPILITLIVAVNPSEFILPPSGFTLKWLTAAWSSNKFLDAMWVSLVLGVIASILANAIALFAAIALARYNFRGKSMVNVFLMSPILIPATIYSLALYVLLANAGFAGSTFGLIVGHTVYVLPFAVRILTASLQNFDVVLEEAARNVGAGRLKTLFFITLPVIKTGLISSLILCFLLSWNDFPISVFLAPADWIPLPVELYSYIKFNYDAVGAALAASLIIMAAVAMVVIERLVGIRRALGA